LECAGLDGALDGLAWKSIQSGVALRLPPHSNYHLYPRLSAFIRGWFNPNLKLQT
jgi:hypothetical protein